MQAFFIILAKICIKYCIQISANRISATTTGLSNVPTTLSHAHQTLQFSHLFCDVCLNQKLVESSGRSTCGLGLVTGGVARRASDRRGIGGGPVKPGVVTPGVVTPEVVTPGVVTPGVVTPGVGGLKLWDETEKRLVDSLFGRLVESMELDKELLELVFLRGGNGGTSKPDVLVLDNPLWSNGEFSLWRF